ncbi:hypothetical protein CAMSH0001_1398 [Campylobacter showae RM3277]|uniref:Uncharacterized protein n=1 Tax=Campylobacter showae RM3277 TaxID=553219 RepID=C6RIQ1_9BACT|nr:hypothetical protein CAMSH0001_1398 [Campylobacter showae RM3277]
MSAKFTQSSDAPQSNQDRRLTHPLGMPPAWSLGGLEPFKLNRCNHRADVA